MTSVKAYVLFFCLKQLCHQFLRKPDSFILKPYFNFRLSAFGLIDQGSALGDGMD